jgi:hypothetical protein
MASTLFGPTPKSAIKVGYIDPVKGYVESISITAANKYAKKNPGTVFIFLDGDKNLRYLNINEVNALTKEDIVSTSSTCSTDSTLCGPPRMQIFGGGGIGAFANPVISSNGSIIAVDLVHGGHGYQFEPFVEAKDDCNIGAGAVFDSRVGIVTSTITEYDKENDFEIYLEDTEGEGNICPTNYGNDGEALGTWCPDSYFKFDPNADPIKKEIDKYQNFLKELPNPWWTSRKKKPVSIISSAGKNLTQTYDVSHPCTNITPTLKTPGLETVTNSVPKTRTWSDFMNSYAISPIPVSNTIGSDFAGVLFTIEWEETFPYAGEYVIRGCRDNEAKLYVDNEFVSDLQSFNQDPVPIKRRFTEGNHKIRVDLLNIPIYEDKAVQAVQVATSTQPPAELITILRFFTADFSGPALTTHFYTSNPNDEFIQENGFVLEGPVFKLFKSSANVPGTVDIYRLFKGIIGDHFFTTSGAEKDSAARDGYVYEGVVGKAYSQPGPDRVEVVRYFRPSTGEHFYTTTIEDSQREGWLTGLGYVKEGTAFYAPTAAPIVETPATPSSSPIKNVNVFNTVDYISKANRNLWRTNPAATATSDLISRYGVCPFDTKNTLNDNPYAGTHTIIWDNINFPVNGTYTIQIAVDDNVTLYIGDTVIRKDGFIPGTSTGTGDFNEVYSFKAGNYTIRAELEQIPGGKFGFSGEQGTNPMALAINIETVYTTTKVVSPKSWCENPMGVSLTIDAPEPPIPQEVSKIPQIGRCPNNPIWTTRNPNSSQKWWPVRYYGKITKTINNANSVPVVNSSQGTTASSAFQNSPTITKTVPAWSEFTNRYAISPVPPLLTNGSDAAGITFTNTWDIEIPYSGYYGFKGTADNIGRILVDGVEVAKMDGFNNNDPKLVKKYIEKGNHVITTEVYNQPIKIPTIQRKNIFNTSDWIADSPPPLKTVDVQFNISIGGQFANKFNIDDLGISVSKSFNGQGKNEQIAKTVEYGRVYTVKLATSRQGQIKLRTKGNSLLQVEDYNDYNWTDMQCFASVGRFFDLNGSECKFIVDNVNSVSTITGGTVKNDVIYEGPTIASYRPGFISPAYFDATGQEVMGKTFIMRWSNVDFPETGQYKLKAEADDLVIVKIDGIEVGRAKVFEGQVSTNFNVSQGKRTLELELTNIPGNPDSTFETNPIVAAVIIEKDITVYSQTAASWQNQNPVGISAVMIAPPCPKPTGGKGVVTEIIVNDPGNGYLPPAGPTSTYPVTLQLSEVVVTNPGINYNCGVDVVKLVPDNGAILSYSCDSFGRISKVNVVSPGTGFVDLPQVVVEPPPGAVEGLTGINFDATPILTVVRDPVGVATDNLIQVTDLVGLKQTGYVDGRPYYGAVFYENNVKYAGYFKTVGTPTRVYDTLQESITAKVTTTPSAIQRSGTDINSNNPTLNIPNTPQNLI